LAHRVSGTEALKRLEAASLTGAEVVVMNRLSDHTAKAWRFTDLADFKRQSPDQGLPADRIANASETPEKFALQGNSMHPAQCEILTSREAAEALRISPNGVRDRVRRAHCEPNASADAGSSTPLKSEQHAKE
jgi:hypothetical protein